MLGAGAVGALVVAGSAGVADARPRPAHSEKFEANKGFGVGLMLGAPSGLALKYYLDDTHAIDGGIGVSRYTRGRDGVHLHIDYLWHPVQLASADPFVVPLYLGIGARVFDFDDDDKDDGTAIGVRAPLGVMLDFNNVPLDIFLEGALVADVIVSHRDNADLDFNVALGARYYFN